MAKLGYRPHAAARGMRGQTYTLGVMLPDIKPVFTEMVDGIDEALVAPSTRRCSASANGVDDEQPWSMP